MITERIIAFIMAIISVIAGFLGVVKNDETVITDRYVYSIDGGEYSSYAAGKVIPAEKAGEKLADVTVTAGWLSSVTGDFAEEHLRAEVFAIEGVSPAVAVCLKFTDKGSALTTSCFYAQINPAADTSQVSEYVITYAQDLSEE